MTAIVVDKVTSDKLRSANDVSEIRDESGKLLGRFVPAPASVIYIVEGEIPSDEELSRRMREGKRHTPEQVMQRLQELKEKLA
jgi:hypothetical protein